jgi:carbonic anhydrase/acetyltransferase-like protein (isoleucine patch superfamily)
VHGTSLGSRVLVGMGAVILSRSVVADEVLVAAGAVVPEEMNVRAGVLVAGVPAKEKRELDERNRARLKLGADHYLEYGRRYRESLAPAGEQ